MRTIGVDLDGTLCEDCDYDRKGFMTTKPRPQHIKLVNALYDEGNTIIIWTGRDEEFRPITERWLKKHGVKYHRLVMDKLRVDIYIDEARKLMPVDNDTSRR